MGPIVRLIGSGIGLASESLAHRKESKGRSKSPGQARASSGSRPNAGDEDVPPYAPPAYDSSDALSTHYGLVETANEQQARELIEKGQAVPVDEIDTAFAEPGEENEDEAYWQLDEAAALHDPSSTVSDEEPKGGEQKPDVHKLVQKFLAAHPPPSSPPPPLQCPVILPQRRPHSKSRGFVRAYAPLLGDCGIDQGTWIEFLKIFHKSQQASAIFDVIFVGGHLVGYVPSVTAMAVAISIQVAAGTAIALQSRHRTNTFLDEINAHFFRPRGLYALLMSYKSERSSLSSAPVDISHQITHSLERPEGMGSKLKNNLKFTSGKTYTEMELPAAAPLIFPDLDAVTDVKEDTEAAKEKQNVLKRSSKFVGDYLDRRAQAEYNHDNPNSSLAVPDHKPFASRYSDPNHPASSGSLVSLVTGGHVDPFAARNARKAARGPRGPIGHLRKATGTDKPLRKILRQNVIYLMVVNLPSEEEMASARAEIEREKAEKEAKKGK